GGGGGGGGVVAVERLSRARALGHRVLAVVAGSAVNQDGASNGLTAPNGRAQEEVIARALADAGVGPVEVDVVEAHGTGTRLGDPIEAQAVIAAYGRGRPVGRPLWLGSLKSNIGHAQAAAGVGGVIKMVMALRRGVLPQTLHVGEASPLVGWAGSGVELLRDPVEWPQRDGVRRAGVSSFGISGTNAHVILEQAPADPEPENVPDGEGSVPLVLSAKTATALRAQAGALHNALTSGTAPRLRDIGFTLARRPRFEHRAVVDADDENAAAALAALRDGGRHPRVEDGRVLPDQRLAFLFSGQGTQRTGMGAELLETSAPYAEAFDEISATMEPLLDVGLRELITGDPEPLRRTRYAQPALFALEVALYRLTESHGLRPDFLIGHSVGELAAAHVAGVLDLADACALIAARGRLMQSAREGGAMAAFAATEAEAAELAATSDGRVEIAAVNGPVATVLSGDADELDRLVRRWKDAGRRAARLKVAHAFHSAHMDGVLDEFRRVVSGLSFHTPRVPVISTVTGALAGEREMSAPDYWVAQLRGTVRFADAVRAAHRSGVTRFAELGPDGSLAAMARESAGGVLAVPLLRPGRPEAATFGTALGRLHAAGVPVDFGPLLAGGRLVDLPTYPFETRHYWLLPAEDDGRPATYGLDASPHPLLTASAELPDGARLFTGALSARRQPWLAEHRVDGRALVPAAALAELALAIGASTGRPALGDFVMHAPLELDGTAETQLQVSVSSAGELTVRGRTAGTGWATHVTAVLTDGEVTPSRTAPPPGRGTRLDAGGPEAAYRLLAEHGYEYGPAFQGLGAAWLDGTDLHAEAELPAPLRGEATRYGLHPALLDAVLHTISLHGIDGPAEGRRVPYALDGVRLHAAHATRVRAHLTLVDPVDPDTYRVDLFGDDGRAVLTVERLRLRPLPSAAGLYRLHWEAVAPPAPAAGDLTVAGSLPERLTGTVLLALTDDGDDPYAEVEAARQAVRRWLAEADGGRLVFLTRGLAIDDGETARPSTAALWGLVRAARAEHPGRFALLDIGDDDAADADPALLAAIGTELPEAALRDGVPRVPRLSPEPEPERGAVPGAELVPGTGTGVDGAVWPRSAEGGTVLITGGLGALGRRIARHLVTRYGVRNLLLVSRRGEGHPDAARAEAELAGLGARVTVRACDPSDRDALAALLAALDTPLTGVVHAAGVVEDAAVERLSADALRRTIEAKAVAAGNLDEATRDAELDAFVLFGSVAGVVGTAGQGGYCAANAALEAITHRRRLSGGHGVTVHWGLWDIGAGMGAGLTDRDVARLGRAGIKPMSEADGTALFDRVLRLDAASVVAARLDPRAAERHRGTSAVRRAPAPDTAGAPATPVRNTSHLVLDAVAAVLGHADGAEVEPERSFSDLGFDSLTAVELRNRLSDELGVRLPGTIVFDHPNPVALVRFLDETTGAGTRDDEPEETVAPGRAADDDAIAIVGMACRFPGGVRTPAELWELLASGGDAISGFPTDRGWDPDLFDPDPERSGTSYTRHGGFLRDAAEFDPGFFGISPREALAVDPQQRLLLQTAWEAVEDAGIDPAALRGTQSGVFVGVMYSDYGARVHQRRGTARDLEGYLVSGSAGSVASGRISFTLGLEGPAVTVDTACSSSLVAVHQAAQSLRSGECALALAGGVTVMASPATFIEFSRQRGLAPDGRCKPFSADADGTAWGEGVGLLVLERLSDARRNGHRVLAVVRGSAVNQDGASNGLTAPNGPSQERVIRSALRGAGLRPVDVDVLEAHGTGTRLGDPIEAGAVLNTYGRDREDRGPLLMGSVKSNIGHTQAAAGVAGIIKMVLAMRHGRVPATLHRGRLTEHVDWSGGTVSVPAEPAAWPDTPGPRRAAVSSFGISGTNAHVILESGEEAPSAASGAPDGASNKAAGAVVPWVLSARDAAGLREQAVRLRRHVLADPGLRVVDVALSLATTRTAFERRAVVLGRDRDELLAGLDHLVDGTATPPGSLPSVLTGTPARGGTAVLFTGQGSQRVGMGAELHRSFPAYARAFDEVSAEFRGVDGTDVAGVVSGDAAAGPIDQTRYTQAALFAVEVALFRLLESWGLPADLVAGHSIGEITAAHVGGALSLPDAVALVAVRGRLMQELPPGGAMTAVQADPPTVERLIAETGARVDVAAVNAPGSVVLSGDAEAVEELAGVLAGSGHRVRPLTVSHAFHSAHMEPMLAAFREEIGDLPTGPVTRTVVSTLTAREAGADTLGSAAHWAAQVRGTVRFADAVGRMRELGAARFLEVGPDAGLTAMVRQHDLGEDGVAISTLDRGHDDPFALWSFVARAFVAGVAWDWRALLGEGGGDAVVVPLPTYPFHRERLWLLPPAEDGTAGTAAGIGAEDPGHPLLTASITVPDGAQTLYTGVLSQRRQPWLADHALAGTPILPATALVDLLGWLADRHGKATVRELTLHAPVAVGAEEETHLRVTVADDAVRVHARPGRGPAADEWTLHAEAVLGDAGPAPGWSGHRPPEARPVDVTGIYAAFAERGYDYGPAFQGLRALWTTGEELYAEVDTGDDLVPGLLDAALHPWIADAGEAVEGGIRVPHTWREVHSHGKPRGPLRVRIRHTGEETFALDVVSVSSADADGVARPVLSAGEVRVRRIEESALLRGGGTSARPYELAWSPTHLAGTAPADGGSGGHGGDTIVLVRDGDGLDLPFPTVTYGGEQDGQDPAVAVRSRFQAVRESILTLPERAHLVVVTRGAVAVDGDDRLPGLAESALWGLVRAARQEYPGRISVVDVDGHGESSALLPRAVAARPGELAIRRGGAFRPRLRAVAGAPGTPPELGTGTVLVSGAGGALGAEVVRHLVAEYGARHLLLVSRRGGADPALRALAEELGDRARVRTAACDLADATATEALLADLDPGRPLGAVFHIAGTLDDAVLENTTGERLERVLRPKVDAAWNLHRLTRDLPLTAFVLFSSVAGVLGNAGQTGYAAANAFLDALAHHRRAAGLPGASLAWGLWETGSDAGMAAGLDGAARARLDRLGIRALPVDAGLGLLDRSLASGLAVVVPVWFDQAALARRRDDLPEVLGGLVPVRPAGVTVPLARRLPGMDEAASRTVVRDTVAGRVAEVLGLAGPARVPDDRGLFDLGLDSLTAIELRNRLGTEVGERLPATVLFDHPTVRALTEHLLERYAPDRPAFDTAALDTWVSSASDLAPDHRRRVDLVRALRAALNALDTGGAAGGVAVNGGGEPLFGVDSASDDELFGLLDRELSD
ncbi:SDR family NAD(P)-dependent oxidoreductase, partial [Streptosporangium oxazolinicum]|uniref:SDR family NAD(P)-dependent oxidoreductase n=1 Tax=Streptosporangium oxazolinicum TaxID=909287 RepID=UPI003CD0B268